MSGTAVTEGRSRATGKSATAFRTISEVSVELEVPQHVLRFWETKFPQIKPLKRGGGRRYYRPDDVELLRRIQQLLHREGYTIKGVQRLLKESRAAETMMPAADATEMEPETASLFDSSVIVESQTATITGTVRIGSDDRRRQDLRALLHELMEIRALLP